MATGSSKKAIAPAGFRVSAAEANDSSATRAPANTCFHCGEPIPDGTSLFVLRDGQRKAVCCAGCQAVAELIFGAGLGRYYQFRQELGRKAEADLQGEISAWEGCDARESLWGAERTGNVGQD